MTNEEFRVILEQCIEKLRNTLITKASEYAKTSDRLYNFKRGAEVIKRHLAQICVGYMTKHLVSLLDLVDDLVNENYDRVRNLLEEKLGDTIVYMVLLEALIKEEIYPPVSDEVEPDNLKKESIAEASSPFLDYYICKNCKKKCSISINNINKLSGIRSAYGSDCCKSDYEIVKEKL